MNLYLYNTETRKTELFEPLEPGRAKMYCCGPTVYTYAHIGNLRAYVFNDILRRTLELAGYEVSHVMNITDVGHLSDDADEGEDKMIKGARDKGMSVWDIAAFFADAFNRDARSLNILEPTVVCKATEHIREMIDFIKKIEENGYTYKAGGNVYFDTSKLSDYGRLAGLRLEDLKAGARTEIDENKKNPSDFVLWFTKSKFENQVMVWDSPWGKGYPGWHIECSAMSSKYLGSCFDIHCGGVDHIPVHHTNEIAQSEAALGGKWVNYWLHNEFLIMKEGKMSKSKGGFITLQTLIDRGYDPLDYRYFLLGSHYRSQQMFSFESLDAARSARNKLVRTAAELKSPEEKGNGADSYISKFKENLFDDLNTPRCLAVVWDMLKDEKTGSADKYDALIYMDKIFGLNLDKSSDSVKVDPELQKEIEALILKRNKARQEKDFKTADNIRHILTEKGIAIKDTPQGTIWSKM